MQLLDTSFPTGQSSFVSHDSEKLFKYNLRKQPLDWYWRNNEITYTLNEQGYRCNDWDNCDWSESIVLIGGSDIFGLGVKDEHTVSHRLEEVSKTSVINLGVCSASPMFMWINSTILSSHNIRPKAVVYLWTEPSRVTTFTSDNGIDNVRDGSHGITRLGSAWATQPHQGYQFLRYCMMNIELIWKCPIVQYSPLFVEEIDWHDVNKSKRLEILDYGRDLYKGYGHYGPKTYNLWAEIFLNDIKL